LGISGNGNQASIGACRSKPPANPAETLKRAVWFHIKTRPSALAAGSIPKPLSMRANRSFIREMRNHISFLNGMRRSEHFDGVELTLGR
jgi:hypothetical protein